MSHGSHGAAQEPLANTNIGSFVMTKFPLLPGLEGLEGEGNMVDSIDLSSGNLLPGAQELPAFIHQKAGIY